jgi:lantibiotic modifying enzyme
LYAHTNDEPFRIGAQRFLEYERQYYDEAEQNWQDLRTGWSDDSQAPRFAMSWSHGAPGIALARVRTQQILNNPEYEQEAEIALLRTASAVHQAIRSPDAYDFSLSNGAAGLADVLLTADQLSETTRFHALVRELADVGIKRFRAECAWPSGVSGGDNPGLLLGLAGTGYFYLRLANPDAVPTVLLT